MDWFYFLGGPLDYHKTGKMVQSHGGAEHIVQVPDVLPVAPGEVMLYGAVDDDTVAHKNHRYVRQHRGDGRYSPSATFEYKYAGVMT